MAIIYYLFARAILCRRHLFRTADQHKAAAQKCSRLRVRRRRLGVPSGALFSYIVCCSLLQSVAVCCSLLQSDYESAGAAWVSLIKCFVLDCVNPVCVAVCCSMLQYVAVCCSMLQYVAVCCGVLQWQCIAV